MRLSIRFWSVVALCLLFVLSVLAAGACGGGDGDGSKDDASSSASPSASGGGSNGSATPDGDGSTGGPGSASGSETPGPGQGGATPPPGGGGSSGPFPTPEVPPGQTPAPHGSLELVAIDMDASGNSATSISSIERCATVAKGGSLTVDIVIVGIPAVGAGGGEIIGTEFTVLYDAQLLRVADIDDEMILAASPGAAVLTVGDATPDSDGAFYVASLDTGSAAESGNGVLVRLTLQAIASGQAVVSIQPGTGYYIDNTNKEQFFGDVSTARAVIGGGSC